MKKMKPTYEVRGQLWLLHGGSTGARNHVDIFSTKAAALKHMAMVKKFISDQVWATMDNKTVVSCSKKEEKYWDKRGLLNQFMWYRCDGIWEIKQIA